MRLHLDCIPCFQRQALQAARFVTGDEEIQESILREVAFELMKQDWKTSPPRMARMVHQIVRDRTGATDPYRKVKRDDNQTALELYPWLSEVVHKASEPLSVAVRLAIAGNIIDLGASETYDLQQTINEVLVKPLGINHYTRFFAALEEAHTLIYLADNSGEVVFDRLLLETILEEYPLDRIVFVIKGAPKINDATLLEAREAEIDRLPGVEFHKMGVGIPGSGYVRESPEFAAFLGTGDMVISKGQGNYEGLSDHDDIFFLLMAKCPVIAAHLGVETGDIILKGGA